MVVTDRPETSFTAVVQARAASPSICTVQAPHSATPQPYFVPVSPNSSRRYQSNGIDGSPSKDCSWPLTRNVTMACLSDWCRPKDSISEGANAATLLMPGRGSKGFSKCHADADGAGDRGAGAVAARVGGAGGLRDKHRGSRREGAERIVGRIERVLQQTE